MNEGNIIAYMLRRCFSYLIMLAALLLFCSCSGAIGPAQPTLAGLSEEPSASPLHTSADYDNRFAGSQFGSFVEIDDAVLWHDDLISSPFVEFFDKTAWSAGNEEPYGVMCARPECEHNSEDCDGYMDEDAPSLSLMDGKLYWVAWQKDAMRTVYRANRDFTDKERICSFEIVGKYTPVRYCFHRGRLYFYSVDLIVGPTAEPYDSVKLCSCDHSSGVITELISIDEPDGMVDCRARFVGEDIYFLTVVIGGLKNKVSLYRYNISEGKTETLLLDDPSFMSAQGMQVTDDGTVYIGNVASSETPGALYVLRDNNLEPVMTFDGGKYRVCPLEKAVVAVGMEGRYAKTLWVRDYEGNTLYSGELPTELLGDDLYDETLMNSSVPYEIVGDGETIMILFHIMHDAEDPSDASAILIRYEIADGELITTLMGQAP